MAFLLLKISAKGYAKNRRGITTTFGEVTYGLSDLDFTSSIISFNPIPMRKMRAIIMKGQ